jgi:triosephosphate isomerase
MGRKFFVGGNWKMNGDKAAIEGICNTLKSADTDSNVGKILFDPLYFVVLA